MAESFFATLKNERVHRTLTGDRVQHSGKGLNVLSESMELGARLCSPRLRALDLYAGDWRIAQVTFPVAPVCFQPAVPFAMAMTACSA